MAILTTEGKTYVIGKLQNLAPIANAIAQMIGWGTGSAAEAVGLTFGSANITEAGEARVTGVLSQPTTLTDRLVGTMVATATSSITQVWRTNTLTKGGAGQIMYIYALFTAIPVQSGDSVAFTIDYVQA